MADLTGGIFMDTYGGGQNVNAQLQADSVTRYNNTVTINGFRVRIYTSGGGSIYDPGSWSAQGWIPSGSSRVNGNVKGGSPSSISSGSNFYTGKVNFSFSVGRDTSSTDSRVRWGGGGVNPTKNSGTIGYPSIGSPAGTTAMDAGSTTDSVLGVRNDVTTWGANAGAGAVRSYIADNSGFSGQTYKGTSDNALITHTGLTPNKRYWFRGWAENGGGKTAYHSSTSGVTKSLVSSLGSTDIQAVSVKFINVGVTQGEYTTTAKVQYRKKGSATWLDSATKTGTGFDIEITGLQPSTTYERRFSVTTTAGTTDNEVYEFTTLPAGKLVYPDGTVKNAIPRIVRPDGTVIMVQMKEVEP